MTYKVLVVDDSNFFRHRLIDIINEHPDLKVVGTASNGQEGIDKAEKLSPDIITMDYEMPLLDGLSALRVIMERKPIPIVMFSSLTYEGAKVTLDALEAGAVDFISKNFAEVSGGSPVLKKRLHDTLISFSRRGIPGAESVKKSVTKPLLSNANSQVLGSPSGGLKLNAVKQLKFKPAVVMIGASTGGPLAVAKVICQLPSDFPIPIVITQHMPPNFTRAFAERLNRQSELEIVEAKEGDRLQPCKVFVAPGGKQLMFNSHDRGVIKIIDGDDRVIYKPSVDIAFASSAKVFGNKVLAIVLTGMGSDGCEGAQLLKNKGAVVWAQDEASCVVYGMPKAVVEAKIADCIVDIKSCGSLLKKVI